MGDVDDAGLDVGGGVEHLACHVSSRGDDHELVEDGDAAQRSAGPFGVVLFEFGINGLEKGAIHGALKIQVFGRWDIVIVMVMVMVVRHGFGPRSAPDGGTV